MTSKAMRAAGGGVPWPRLAAAVWAVLLAGVAVRSLVQHESHDCYKPFYEPAGRNWLHGIDEYQLTTATCRYSPLANALFAPLALTPTKVGGLLWRGVNAGAFLGGLAWWLRVYAADWTPTRRAWAFLLVIPLSLSTINSAQANPLLTGLLIAGTAAAGRGRWNWAAGLVAGACLLKIYPVALALLLVVTFPRRFLPPFLVALAAGLALPFALQDPAWVARQYHNWWVSLCIDDRTLWPFAKCYRDLWMVIRFYRLPVSYGGYVAIELALAAAAAAVCLAARWRFGRPPAEVANTALGLAVCWMTVCGPTTEAGGYVLVAPTAAWAFLEAWGRPSPPWLRALLLAGAALFTVGTAVAVTPDAGDLLAYGWHPVAGLLLLAALMGEAIRRLAAARTAQAGASPVAPARAA
jgi:hypothetical protein